MYRDGLSLSTNRNAFFSCDLFVASWPAPRRWFPAFAGIMCGRKGGNVSQDNSERERRAHARHSHRMEIEGSGPEGVVASMVTSDLSLGGLHCVSSADFPEMTRLAVRLALPPRNGDLAEPLEIEAVVVRREALVPRNGAQHFELALFFTRLAPDDRARLAQFLAA